MGLSFQEHRRHKKEPDERPQESSEDVSYVGGIASSSYVMVKDLLGEVKDNNGVPYIVDGKLNRDISLDTGTVERCTIFSGSFNKILTGEIIFNGPAKTTIEAKGYRVIPAKNLDNAPTTPWILSGFEK